MGRLVLFRTVGLAAVAGTALVACGSKSADEVPGDDLSVETTEPDAPISNELLAVGDVLLAPRHYNAPEDQDPIFASTDAGTSWEPVELPGAPDNLDLDLPGLRLVEDMAVVSGRALVESNGMDVPGGDAYVWASDDGLTWQGGRIADGGPAFTGVSVAGVGDQLLAGVMTGSTAGPVSEEPGSFTMVRSDDGGASWSPVELPELDVEPQETLSVNDAWQVDGDRVVVKLGGRSRAVQPEVEVFAPDGSEPATDVSDTADRPEASPVDLLVSTDQGRTWQPASCEDEELLQHGVCGQVEDYGELLVDGSEVSVDGGATWQEPVIDPDPEHSTPDLTGVVDLPGGGWMAAGYNTEAGDVSFGYLLQSSDGVQWTQLLGPDSCDQGRPNSRVLVPTPLGDGWLVAYNCVDLNWPEFARLYLVDGDGGDLEEIEEGATDKLSYSQPRVVGDTVVVAGQDEDGNVTVVQLRP